MVPNIPGVPMVAPVVPPVITVNSPAVVGTPVAPPVPQLVKVALAPQTAVNNQLIDLLDRMTNT